MLMLHLELPDQAGRREAERWRVGFLSLHNQMAGSGRCKSMIPRDILPHIELQFIITIDVSLEKPRAANVVLGRCHTRASLRITVQHYPAFCLGRKVHKQ